jgi:S-adenosylmethionine:tRNA ribosyltransferase-isomerase
MKTEEFNYYLPEELIANYPLENRANSKLLVLENNIEHKKFYEVQNYFEAGDLLILNETSVIPARIFGKKETGGQVEIFLERILDDNKILVQIRSSRSPKTGSQLIVNDKKLTVEGRQGSFYILKLDQEPLDFFNEYGHVPLPPYIKRADEELDKSRYATVYENKSFQDSVAAPTAGLHFTSDLLDIIKNAGVEILKVNLSVGAGTFHPVKAENIKDHKIHSEYAHVSDYVVSKILDAKTKGKKVTAVGTTVTRALESAFFNRNPSEFKGYTELYITPGFSFKAIDRLITNFHLPKSSLLMLVAAFVGMEEMKDLYNHAVENRYRFLSYGDAMMVNKKNV